MTTPTTPPRPRLPADHRRDGDARAAPATRSTPRSSPAGSRPAGSASSTDPADAETVVVNTCGFVEAAKKDSVDTLLAAADLKEAGADPGRGGRGLPGRAVRRRAGHLAARGRRGARLRRLPRHRRPAALDPGRRDSSTRTRPQDRRRLLPISPAERADAPAYQPGHGERRRLDAGPMAPLKLASGCDRRCTFCAIPAFRGSFVSRRPSDVLAEARWLAGEGARELFLVCENSTSYGKDLGDLRLLETLLPELAAVDGVERVRVSYLQPAETRPGLVTAIAATPGRGGVLRPLLPARLRTRCCGGCGASATPRRSWGCSTRRGRRRPRRAPARTSSSASRARPSTTSRSCATSSPRRGSTRSASSATPTRTAPRPSGFEDKLDEDEIADRVAHVTALAEELTAQRAEERLGEQVVVLVESVEDGVGRGARRPPGPRGRRLDHAGRACPVRVAWVT